MLNSKPSSFYVVGGGRAGASLAYYFLDKGFPVIALTEKNPERRRFLREKLGWKFVTNKLQPGKLKGAQIILMAVQDDRIGEAVKQLAGHQMDWRGKTVIHTSGAVSSSVLEPLQKSGATVGSLHPVFSFSLDPRKNTGLENVFFDLEGDQAALEIFKVLFAVTGNRLIPVTAEQKMAIHLASVFYANFYGALASFSTHLLDRISISESEALRMLNPLLQSAIDRVSTEGVTRGLTGPVRRGDCNTIATHLEYLNSFHPRFINAYILLSRKLLELSPLSPEEKERIQLLFVSDSEQ